MIMTLQRKEKTIVDKRLRRKINEKESMEDAEQEEKEEVEEQEEPILTRYKKRARLSYSMGNEGQDTDYKVSNH
jgi:hypothetical protein